MSVLCTLCAAVQWQQTFQLLGSTTEPSKAFPTMDLGSRRPFPTHGGHAQASVVLSRSAICTFVRETLNAS